MKKLTEAEYDAVTGEIFDDLRADDDLIDGMKKDGFSELEIDEMLMEGIMEHLEKKRGVFLGTPQIISP